MRDGGSGTAAGGAERRLLLVAPADYDSSVAKGVASLLHDFDEQGYFAKVVMVFPFTAKDRVIDLGDRLVIHELGAGGGGGGSRPARLLRKAATPLQALRAARRTAALARSEGATLIRATDPCLSGFVALIAARLSARKLAVSIHADFDKRHELDPVAGAPRVLGSRRIAVAIDRLVLRRADAVLPIRESLIDYARRRGAKAERISVIPHGADLTAFTTPAEADARSALGLPEGKRIVSFVGRLSPENYIDDVITVARRVGEARSDVVVAIAGGGSEADRIAREVDGDAVLARTIRLVGFRPRGEIAALRQASAVSLCPMGGFSLIEACAAGSPVVAYDAEWHRELVIDGETGYLVAEHDVAGLAHAVLRLLDDPVAAGRMGTNARGRALSRHSLEAAAAVKRRIYDRLIGGGG